MYFGGLVYVLNNHQTHKSVRFAMSIHYRFDNRIYEDALAFTLKQTPYRKINLLIISRCLVYHRYQHQVPIYCDQIPFVLTRSVLQICTYETSLSCTVCKKINFSHRSVEMMLQHIDLYIFIFLKFKTVEILFLKL